ncbi:protein of unknown function [Candidatus Methylacidiphilum fumarolicum]|uniref:Uncharacterized protein n=1 Tax=Candidatus Methylacidiphilum fumarolicum TaxID=591154 RepID=A0ABN8XE29_9BACT|nr:protein of unknown function [Candidatus Methylacidiphilum fumarolicum]
MSPFSQSPTGSPHGGHISGSLESVWQTTPLPNAHRYYLFTLRLISMPNFFGEL